MFKNIKYVFDMCVLNCKKKVEQSTKYIFFKSAKYKINIKYFLNAAGLLYVWVRKETILSKKLTRWAHNSVQPN